MAAACPLTGGDIIIINNDFIKANGNVYSMSDAYTCLLYTSGVLHFCLGEFAGRLDAPAGKHLVGIVVMMMVMAAAAVAVMVVMMLVLVLVIVVIVVVMVAAAAMVMIVMMVLVLIVVIIFIVIVVMLVLVLVVIIIVVVMMAAAAHTVLVIVVMVVVMLFFVLVGVLFVGLCSHGNQLCLEVVLGGHGLQDLLTGQRCV